MTLLAIVAIHTAANEPPKVRQLMNKIHRNVGELTQLAWFTGDAAWAERQLRGVPAGADPDFACVLFMCRVNEFLSAKFPRVSLRQKYEGAALLQRLLGQTRDAVFFWFAIV